SSRRRHTRFSRDWSSDVCSSDLHRQPQCHGLQPQAAGRRGGAVNSTPAFAMSLPVFNQLLEPANMAPALDYRQSGTLVYVDLPAIESRARLRFIVDPRLGFRAGSREEVSRLLRHWRAELSPQIEEDEGALVAFQEDQDFNDLDSEAPVIRLVNHLFARALDLNASDIHFEPTETHLEVRCRVDGIMTRIERL